MQSISKKELFQLGWETFKKQWKILLGTLAIMWVISVVFEGALGALEEMPLVGFVVLLVYIALSVLLQIGLTRITLNLAYARPASIRQLFEEHTIILRFLGASVMYVLIVLGGFLLLIVPGIIWAIKYSQFRYLIVDKNVNAFDSLSQSAKLTDGHKMQLFWLGVLLTLLNIAGALAFVVGLLITIPVTVMVYAHLYKKLTELQSGVVAEMSSESNDAQQDEQVPADEGEQSSEQPNGEEETVNQ
jgi:uncharacterized membrane protein